MLNSVLIGVQKDNIQMGLPALPQGLRLRRNLVKKINFTIIIVFSLIAHPNQTKANLRKAKKTCSIVSQLTFSMDNGYRIYHRVSDPMLNSIPKSIRFLDYLNFGTLFDILLWSMRQNLCNLALVICLLIQNWVNLYKPKFSQWSNREIDHQDDWVTYPIWNSCCMQECSPKHLH